MQAKAQGKAAPAARMPAQKPRKAAQPSIPRLRQKKAICCCTGTFRNFTPFNHENPAAALQQPLVMGCDNHWLVPPGNEIVNKGLVFFVKPCCGLVKQCNAPAPDCGNAQHFLLALAQKPRALAEKALDAQD